jgi:phage-related protein
VGSLGILPRGDIVSYNLGTASGRIVIDGSGASKGFNVAGAAATGFFDVIRNRVDEVRNLGKNLLKVGATTSAGLGLAINTAANFEERLSAIKAVSGATSEEMGLISKAALRIGKDTAFSATEAASAMEELVKAGLSTKDVLSGAADAAVNLAAAGGVGIPEAATIAANAMNNFNLVGKDMPRVVDLIAGAANASAIDVSDFGMSLQQGGAVAAIAGLKFDDLAVAIAEMGNAGIKGSDAGTSLKTFLTNLIPVTDRQVEKFKELGLLSFDTGRAMSFLAKQGVKPAGDSFKQIHSALAKYIEDSKGLKVGTAANEKALQKLGLSTGILANQFFDAEGKIKSLADIQEVLKDATKGMTQEQKLANLSLLFGSDAIRAAAVLSKNGADGYNKMAAAMGKISAADAARTRLDNLKGSLEQLRGSLETVFITIGSVFLPVVRKFVDALTWLVNLFLELPDPIQKAIGVLLGLVAVLSTLVGGAITLAFALGPLIAGFAGMFVLRSLASIILAAGSAMVSGAGAAGIYSVAMARASFVVSRFVMIGRIFITIAKLMRAAWLIMTGPIGIAIAVVLALAAAGKYLYDRWTPFHDLINRIGSFIKGKFISVMQELHRWVQMIAAGFQGFKSGDTGFYTFLFKIGAVARTVWDALVRLGDAFNQNVIPALKAASGGFMVAFLDAWKQISTTFNTSLLPALKQLWTVLQTQLWPAIQQLVIVLAPLIQMWLKMQAILTGAVLVALYAVAMALIKYVIPAIIQVVTWIITKLVPVFTAVIQVLTFVITWIVKFVTALISGVSRAINTVANIIVAAMALIKSVIVGAKNVITAIWRAWWAIFGPVVKASWNLIKAVIGLAIAVVKLTIRKGLELIRAVWSATWGWISSFASSVWGKIKKIVSSAISIVKSIINSGLSAAKGFVNAHLSGILNAISAKLSQAKNKISSFISSAKAFFRNAGSWLYAAGRAVIQGLINGLTSMAGSLAGKISSIANSVKSITQKVLQIRSPSKVFVKIGTAIMDGWISGIKKNLPGLVGVMQKIENRISNLNVSKSKKSAVEKLVASYTSSLSKLNTKLDSVQSKLADAQQKYKDLLQEAKDYAAGIKEATIGSITSITSENDSALTSTAVISALQKRYNDAQAFFENIQALQEAGLNKEYLQQLVEAGAESGGAVAAALAGDLSSIKTINNLEASLATVGKALGAFGVKHFYQKGIDVAAGLVKGLESQEAKLVKSIEKLADRLIAALKKKLKIKSPSQVLADVGADTINGMIAGMENRKRALGSLADSVGSDTIAAIVGAQKKIGTDWMSASIGSSGGIAGAPVGGGNTTQYFSFDVNNPLPERTSESTNKQLQKVSTMGLL